REFYRLSCAAVRALMESLRNAGVEPYWAVAEATGGRHWSGFPVIHQGEGGLGSRLAKVYEELRNPGRGAILIGADCPHLTAGLVLDSMSRAAASQGFVLGPSTDGGFYLLAGCRDVGRAEWEAVPYSVTTTADEL